jgi:hypothetical protein
MNVQIDIHQERTVVEGPKFRVSTYTIYTFGIDPNIFVFDVETDTYSHVATVWDMINVRADKIIAQVNREPFYRKDSAIVDYDNQVTAIDAAAYTTERVGSLAYLYEMMNSEFVGEDDHSFVEP